MSGGLGGTGATKGGTVSSNWASTRSRGPVEPSLDSRWSSPPTPPTSRSSRGSTVSSKWAGTRSKGPVKPSLDSRSPRRSTRALARLRRSVQPTPDFSWEVGRQGRRRRRLSKHRQVYTQGGEVGEEPLGPGGVSTRRKETQKGGRRWKRRRAAKAKGSAEKELGQKEGNGIVTGGKGGGGQPRAQRAPQQRVRLAGGGGGGGHSSVGQACQQRAQAAKEKAHARRRRGRARRRGRKSEVDLKLLHMNPRGWTSKRAAILELIDKEKPHYVNINETLLRGNNKVSIKGYKCFSKNREDRAGGGICSAVVDSLKEQAVRVAEGGANDEWQAVRLDHISPAITIINVYGEQEGRTSSEEVRSRWCRLTKDMEDARARGDHVVVAGDLNRQVGNDHLGVAGNHPQVSAGGHLVRDLLASGAWVLVNNMVEKVEGGPFTRVDPASGHRSCLDLWLCTTSLIPHIKSLMIDKERRLRLARPVWKGGNWQLVYSDHFAMILSLKNLPTRRRDEERKKEIAWNLNKKNGWEKYKFLTKKMNEKIKSVIQDEMLDMEEVMERLEKINNKIKFNAFGKTSKKGKVSKKEEPKKDGSEESDKAKELIERQSEIIEKELERIKKKGGGKINLIHKIAKELKGAKEEIAHAVKDPETNKLVVEQEEIKKVSLKYCKKVLERNPPKAEMQKMFDLREKLIEERMAENVGEGFDPTKEDFEEVLGKFKNNNKRGYDFLIKASEEFQDSVFILCKRIIQSENIPDKFRETTLHQIWKRKPGTRKEDLESNRYIHCKEWLARTVEAVVVKAMETEIREATNKFQIGGIPGHRPQEHVFCVKSIIQKYVEEKRLIILICYDISGFFDKEVLSDLMDEMHSIGVDHRAQRLFFKLNKNTKVRVRTGVGDSEWEEVGDIIGQGSVGAAKVSSLNLSRKLDRVFQDGAEMAKYGSVKQKPYSYQDDVLTPVEDVEGMRATNVKMMEVMNLMQTSLNKTKSGFILMGPDAQVTEARQRIKEDPVMCGDFEMKELKEEKWLGDYLTEGLRESVRLTIKKREAKTRRAIFEIIHLINDFRAQRIGGFRTGLVLWESCAIPSLLFNCSTWIGVGKEELRRLEGLQDLFLRMLWAAGQGAPKIALRADTATRGMKSRIDREKVMLIYHISHLGENDLAREMLDEQVSNGWPGLAREVSDICEALRIEDPRSTEKGRHEYNKIVKEACRWADEASMKKEMEKLKKLEGMSKENLEMKEYVKTGTLYTARETWRVRSRMLDLGGNYPNMAKYRKTMAKCQACNLQEREDQAHVAKCDAYQDLREGSDLGNETELVEYFSRVMKRRKENGWD